MLTASKKVNRPLFFPWSEALLLGYDTTPCDLQDLTAARACTVGIQNPDVDGVALGNAHPLIFVNRDLPLVEPAGLRTHYARTNNCLRSEQLGAAFQPPWAIINVAVIDNDAAAPDGVVDADKINETAVAASHFVYQSVGVANSTQYCCSVFVRADERDELKIACMLPGGNAEADFDISTPSATLVSGDSAGVEYWGAGWYRCFIVFTTGIADAGARPFRFYLMNAGASVYLGVAGRGLHLWGAQFEAGHAPSPYIETGAGAVTSIAPVYYSTDPKLLYHCSRDALDFAIYGSLPYIMPDEFSYPIFELWEDANNYIRLSWNPRAAGDRWNLATNTGGAPTAENQNSAFAPVAGAKYLLRLRGAIGGGTWTLDVYSCDVSGMPTALAETITFTNAVTYPQLACNRIYLGSTSAGAGQTDLHFWQVGS